MKEIDPIDVESVILDAELLIKYQMPERGIAALEQALDRHPTNIRLREKLMELYVQNQMLDQAAGQCLALSGLYVRAGDFDEANRCLLEARQLNPRVAVTSRLQEIRRVQQSRQRQAAPAAAQTQTRATLAGNLSDISIFDVVQMLETNRLTGTLAVTRHEFSGKIYLNEGLIVNATIGPTVGLAAFKQLIQEASTGYFTFDKSPVPFAREIETGNNTSLILDLLREYDEENRFDDLPAE
jgi:tetratricopeptide (TPR) repeat protein